jgi:hypothetical protein
MDMLYSKTLLMLVFGIFWLQLIRVNLMGNPESNFWSWRLPRNLCGTTCPHTSQLPASRIQEPCVSAANACECREGMRMPRREMWCRLESIN